MIAHIHLPGASPYDVTALDTVVLQGKVFDAFIPYLLTSNMIELITIVGIPGKQGCGRAACRYMYASSKSLLANFHASRARLLLRYTHIKEPG